MTQLKESYMYEDNKKEVLFVEQKGNSGYVIGNKDVNFENYNDSQSLNIYIKDIDKIALNIYNLNNVALKNEKTNITKSNYYLTDSVSLSENKNTYNDYIDIINEILIILNTDEKKNINGCENKDKIKNFSLNKSQYVSWILDELLDIEEKLKINKLTSIRNILVDTLCKNTINKCQDSSNINLDNFDLFKIDNYSNYILESDQTKIQLMLFNLVGFLKIIPTEFLHITSNWINNKNNIRIGNLSDIHQIKLIDTLCFEKPYDDIFSLLKSFRRIYVFDIDSSHSSHSSHSSKLGGFVSIEPFYKAHLLCPSSLHIHDLAVHPDYRGFRIGTLLLDFIITRFSPIFPFLTLNALKSNPQAVDMYKRRSFISYYEDDEFFYMKRLSPNYLF